MDITLNSVMKQTFNDYEILVSDNASTDDSVEVIKKYCSISNAIKYKVNPINIGFAGNLDEVGQLATGEWMIMLSSDDVIKENALFEYDKFINQIPDSQKFAFCCTFEKIDGDGNFLEFLSAEKSPVWTNDDVDQKLSGLMGYTVYKVAAHEMLNRCLDKFINPFNFASTCYQANEYLNVGKYGGGRLYNPDKWFHWKLLNTVDYVYFLDVPAFQYRWHNNNQVALQADNQTLRYWMDEYRNSFEIDDKMLARANMGREQIKIQFVRRVIYASMYTQYLRKNFILAKRIFHFGLSCYPKQMKQSPWHIVFSIILFNKIIAGICHPVVSLFKK